MGQKDDINEMNSFLFNRNEIILVQIYKQPFAAFKDSVSRLNWDPEREVTISNNVFRDVNIYNSGGEKLESHQLFSEDKRLEMNGFFNNSKKGPIVNILKVADSGIILNSLGNSPKKGILKNLVGRPVGWVGCGSRANGAPCPTPIDVAGPGSCSSTVRLLGSVRNVRGGPGGSGESRGSLRPLGLVHNTLGQGARDRQGNLGLVGPGSCSSTVRLLGSVHRPGVGALGGSVGPGSCSPAGRLLGSVHRTECADEQTNRLRVKQ